MATAGSAVAKQGAELFGRVAQLAAEAGVPAGPGTILNTATGVVNTVADSVSYASAGSNAGRSILARDLEDLADAIASWMGVTDMHRPSLTAYQAVLPPPNRGYQAPQIPAQPTYQSLPPPSSATGLAAPSYRRY